MTAAPHNEKKINLDNTFIVLYSKGKSRSSICRHCNNRKPKQICIGVRGGGGGDGGCQQKSSLLTILASSLFNPIAMSISHFTIPYESFIPIHPSTVSGERRRVNVWASFTLLR